MGRQALVHGLALAGEATAAALTAHGWEVVVADDRPGADAAARAERLGLELHGAPDDAELAALVGGVELVVPSPGIPEHHPLFAAAGRAGVPVRSELDLAYEWE